VFDDMQARRASRYAHAEEMIGKVVDFFARPVVAAID
jgi:hypothetical protein